MKTHQQSDQSGDLLLVVSYSNPRVLARFVLDISSRKDEKRWGAMMSVLEPPRPILRWWSVAPNLGELVVSAEEWQ